MAENTFKQYNSALSKWNLFCAENDENILNIDVKLVIKFLTLQYQAGAKYSTLNSMRAALSLLCNNELSDNTELNRLFKGFYRLRPSKPKYTNTWDVNIVLKELETWIPNEKLTLKKLTLKLVMLLALCTGFRVQNLSVLKMNEIKINDAGVELTISDLVKTSRPGAPQPYAFLPYFINRPNVCCAKIIVDYIGYTKDLRGSVNNLIITIRKPHVAASSQTISRWLRNVLKICNIDEQFTGYSTRHASTSKAFTRGLDVNIIKKAAGWSQSSKVFMKFYNRQIINTEENFAEKVCNSK